MGGMDDWLERNWITLAKIVAAPIFAGVLWMIKIVVSKWLSVPKLRFEAVREKGLSPNEVFWLARITSEPLEGIKSIVAKRRDIQQAKVRAQFRYDSYIITEQFLDSEPDGFQSVNILANNSTYDFGLVLKSQGYAECRIGGYTGDFLPTKTDISVLVSVIEGQRILGQSNFLIHNPDENISNFTVKVVRP